MNKLNFEFTIEQVNIILAALARMPYETVATLIDNVQKQADPQVKSMPREVDPPTN